MKKRKGASLVVVLIIAVFLTILGSTALFLSNSEALKTTKQTDKMKAYYAARSGADAMAEWMNKKTVKELIDYVGETTDWKEIDDGNPNNAKLQYKITIPDNSKNPSVLNIISEGEYNGTTQKVTLTYQSLNVTQEWLLDTTVFAANSVTVGHGATITNTDTTKAALVTNSNSILPSNNPGSINGNVFLGDDATQAEINKVDAISTGTVQKQATERVYQLPTFPDYPDNLQSESSIYQKNKSSSNSINSSGEYPTLDIDGTLTINSSKGSTIEIVVDNLNVKGKINVSGQGVVKIYANSFALDNGEIYKNSANLIIYSKNTSQFGIAGGTTLSCSFYSKSDLNITGNANIVGNIISAGNITLSGNGNANPALFYAPNGTVSVGGSGSFIGNIVAKDMILGNNKSLTYFPIKTDDVPFELPGTDSKYDLDYWYKDVN